MIKQVIVMRTDLNMRKGKMIAQGAHASMKVLLDRIKFNNIENYKDVDNRIYNCLHEYYCLNDKLHECGDCKHFEVSRIAFVETFTDEMFQWINGSFAKIVVGCNSEQELFDLQKQAEETRIVNAIILDNGNTEFKEICSECNGQGTINEITMGKDINIDCEKCNGTGKINKPTYTCLAIGPDESEKIDKITGQLKLL